MEDINYDSKKIIRELNNVVYEMTCKAFYPSYILNSLFNEHIRTYNSTSVLIDVLNKYNKGLDKLEGDVTEIKKLLQRYKDLYTQLICVNSMEKK